MCGIVGFTGRIQAAPVLLDGLAKLEYRGYDSAGIAVKNDDSGKIEIVKVKGRLKQLAEKTDGGRAVPGSCGIGHTRWATHGEPSMVNAHPHFNDDRSIIVVHNGIIENYLELKDKLIKSGYSFYSQTDTEVVTKLFDYYYKKYQGSALEAIVKVMLRVRGSYALGIMVKEEPGVIYSVRKDSPLIVGQNDQGTFIASDVPVLVGLLLPYLLLPVGSFMSGLSLGRRHGFCPLYPLACGVFFLPTVFLLMNYTALPHCLMAAVPALAGNLAGAARRRIKKGKEADAP